MTNPPAPPIPAAPTDPRAAENADKTFTQEQVTAFLTREKDQGERAGKAAVAAALNEKLVAAGLTDVDLDTAIALAASARAAEDAQKSEAQRALEAANTAKADAERIRAEATAELHAAKVTSALTSAGAANVAIAARAIDVTPGATPEEIKAAVDKLKTDAPGLFATTAAPGSDPGTPPGGKPAGQTAKERAAALAEARGWGKPAA